jgi:sugar lactone lactonase YvrE
MLSADPTRTDGATAMTARPISDGAFGIERRVRRFGQSGFAVILVGSVAAAADPLPAKLEPRPLVANINFAEGLGFDSAGNLFFVNYARNGTIGRMTPDGTVGVWLELPAAGGWKAFPFGLKVDAKDNLVIADYGGRRVLRVSPTKVVTTLADTYDGRPLNNPNDVCLDAAGNVYFTDPPAEGVKDSPGSVYRISPQGEVKRLYTGGGYPNGVAVSLDQKVLYLTDTWDRSVLAFDLSEDGTLSGRRVLHRFETPTVDGVDVDPAGRLWVARLQNKTVDVLSAEGRLLASYPMDGDRVTNVSLRNGRLYVSVAGRSSIHVCQVGGKPGR